MSLPANWRAIARAVNAEVNRLPFKADLPGADRWDDMAAGEGDCDNYAIEKLRRLLAHGFPIERLRLATCFVGGTGPKDADRGEPHVVLVIDAPDDQYVLCNLADEPLTHPALVAGRYTRESIQKVGGSREWAEWVVV